MKKEHSNWLPWLPILAAPMLLLGPLLFSGKVLFWGTPALQFVPWQYAAVESIRSGQLPLWNPLVGMGAPLAANYQSALFYPPNWISLVLGLIGGITWIARGQTLLVVLHLVWAGLGMARLTRNLGLGILAQSIAGLAYGLSGYLVARSGFFSINAAAAWLPWVLLGAEKLVSNPGYKVYLLAAVCIALQLLAGHAQTAWYTLLLAFMWVIYRGWTTYSLNWSAEIQFNPVQDRISPRRRVFNTIKAAALLTLAYSVGICLAAVQLIPTTEYLLQSQRASAVDFGFAMTYSFWPWRVLSLLAPGLFGSPVTGDYWGYGNYWEDALYIGLLPGILAIGTVLFMLWRFITRNRPGNDRIDGSTGLSLLPFLVVITMVSFILALGKNTPVFPWLYRYFPTFNMFQAPTRFTLWAEFALIILAAIGADRWRRPEKKGLYWTRLGTASAFAVTLGAGLTWYLLRGIQPTMIRAVALAGLWGLGGGILSLTAPPADRTKQFPFHVWYAMTIIWVMADLLVANWGLNPGIDSGFYNHALPSMLNQQVAADGQRMYISSDDESVLKYKRYFIFKSFDPGLPWDNLRLINLPNLNILDQIPSANNFDPLQPGRYKRWMETIDRADPELSSRMLNLMGVGVVEKLDLDSGAGVRYQNIPGSQRTRFIPCAIYTRNGEESLAKVTDLGLDIDAQVIIEGFAQSDSVSCTKTQTTGNIQLITDQANYIRINLSAGRDGYLVLSDVWYPGWKARLDGMDVPVLRANYLFRAVPVSNGEHIVEMLYRPTSFLAGLLVTLLALLGLGITYRLSGNRDVR